MPDAERRSKLSFQESAIIGCVTGALETCINLPLWTIKTRSQCDLPFTLNPKVLYRGFIASTATMSAFMGFQMTNSSLTEQGMEREKPYVSPTQRIFSAFIGGVIPSVIFCPLDLVITQYHKHNYLSYGETVMQTVKKVGVRGMFAGLPATALVDGNFACCYWGIYPYLKVKLIQNGYSKKEATIISGLSAGLSATFFAHPVDMVRTMQQKLVDEASKESNSMVARFNDLRTNKLGVGLYKGVVPRSIWLMSSITAAGVISEQIESFVLTKRSSDFNNS